MTEPAHLEQLCYEARRMVMAGDYRGAITFYELALKIKPDDSAVHLGLGMAHYLIGNLDAAIESFGRVPQRDPLRATALVNQGATLNRANRYEQAVESLQTAIRLDPSRAETYYNLGNSYRHLGHTDRAIDAYRQASQANPTMANAHIRLARLYLETNRPEMALVQSKKAIALQPDSERAQGVLKESEKAYQRKHPSEEMADARSDRGTKTQSLSHQQRATLHNLAHCGERQVREFLTVLTEEVVPATKALEFSFLQTPVDREEQASQLRNFEDALAHFRSIHASLRRTFVQMGKTKEEES